MVTIFSVVLWRTKKIRINAVTISPYLQYVPISQTSTHTRKSVISQTSVTSIFVQPLFYIILIMSSVQREQNAQTDCRRRDTQSWGKVGRKKTTTKKKNRTCLQGRLKIKRNTIPACIWVESSPPLPPSGRVTRSKCGEDSQSMPSRGRIPLSLLPSDHVLGSLLRPKLSIQLPWLRSVMLHLLNGSNPNMAWQSIFFIQVVQRASLLLKTWQEKSGGVKVRSL